MSHTQEPVTQEPGSKLQDDGATSQTPGSNSQTAAPKPPEKEPLNREIISAPVTKPDGDIKAREDIEKLRRDYHELREKLNTVRENDIITLKDKTSDLSRRFAVGAAIVGLISVFGGFFGFKFFYFDLDRITEDAVKQRIDKAIIYNERVLRASTLAEQDDLQNAISLYQELYDQRPDEEILFFKLLDCLNRAQRYRDALPYIDRARKGGFLADKYKYVFSFNNAGYLVLIASTEDASLRPQAYELLRQAEQIGLRTGDDGIKLPLLNLAIYHAMMGELDEAKKYCSRYRQFESANWQWTPWEGALLNRLQRVRPTIVDDMKKAFSMDQR